MKQEYLKETTMLNYMEPQIQALVEKKKWSALDEYHKIKSIYEFVQNDILFGYNSSDTLTATQVLSDGIGQCNTKATLLMALLRAVGIPCRLHAFDVIKDFQRGATSGLIAILAPKYILHSWVEVFYEDRWVALEGVITDKKYLQAVQEKYLDHKGPFRRYAIATADLQDVSIDWVGNDTFIQKEAIEHDFGVFPSPDELYAVHTQKMSKLKSVVYSQIARKIMTKNVDRIRKSSNPKSGGRED